MESPLESCSNCLYIFHNYHYFPHIHSLFSPVSFWSLSLYHFCLFLMSFMLTFLIYENHTIVCMEYNSCPPKFAFHSFIFIIIIIIFFNFKQMGWIYHIKWLYQSKDFTKQMGNLKLGSVIFPSLGLWCVPSDDDFFFRHFELRRPLCLTETWSPCLAFHLLEHCLDL